MKIGIFDSGAGGLLVMKALIDQLPGVSIVYFGDTARLPYGDKSPAIISRYAHASAAFLAAQGVTLLVIACNTASAYVAEELKAHSSLPVVDVIGPSVSAACKQSVSGRIAILGTWATINSQCYQKLITAKLPTAEITAIPCPLFVPLIEERMAEHPATSLIIEEYLHPLRIANVDTVVLGCTHYPLLRNAITKALGEGMTIIDSASCCAHTTSQLLASKKKNPEITGSPHYQFFVSDNVERFRRLALAFLPTLPPNVEIGLISHD